MQKQFDEYNEAHLFFDVPNLQKTVHQLMEHISKRDEKIKEYRRLINLSEEKISSLQQDVRDLRLQLDANTKHAEGLTALVAYRDQEIHQIYSSSTWKIALGVQRVIRLLFRKK